MPTPIAVCIPSIGKSGRMLHDLIEVCGDEADVVEAWDNQDTLAPIPGVEIVRCPLNSIYTEWNLFAQEYGDTHHLAFLNDDIEMARGTLSALRRACETSGVGIASVAPSPNIARVPAVCRPRAVSGTYRQGGICGWAFMVADGCYPPEGVDDRFRVWYGDDDLVWKVQANGHRAVRCDDLTVRHETSTTINSLPWVPEAQAADFAHWRSLGRP